MEMCRVDGTLVADWSCEEQNWRGGRYSQSRLKSMTMDRANSRKISAPATLVIGLFSSGTFATVFLEQKYAVRKTRSFP